MRILVANRGEIAVRIIRAIRELGHESVAIYSAVDKESLHVKCADYAVCVGEKTAKESYLNMANILSVASQLGVSAIHPGYGFLSERAEFARLCEKMGIKFIGPRAETIDLMGDKINAIEMMKQAEVPIIRGTTDPILTSTKALEVAKDLGMPIIIKAAGGGGGKGLRIVNELKDVEDAFSQVVNEAKITDPNPRIYMEQFITDAKHIEVQVIADNYGNASHLGTRDCSMQRNNQKIIEEAPASISPSLANEMYEASIRAVKQINYEGAGTIEFLVKDNKFYFLEMNTRLQVEHTVSEMVTGVDIVKEQINIALGKELSFKQENVNISGHSIECRINAEDPLHNFAPSPGLIEMIYTPGGTGVRNEFGVYSGLEVSPYYDSLIGKIIIHASTRELAIQKMIHTLEEFSIKGVKTTSLFQEELLKEEEFVNNTYATTFIQNNLERIKRNIEDENVEY